MLNYGVEIWGWKKKEGIERIEKRYLKWVLGVDRQTPGYMIKEKLQKEKLRRTARRLGSMKRD